MASSYCNSSTLVLLLGTPFNMISYFSGQMAYPPNVPWYSRQIHQRGHLSLRSPSSTIQPGWIVLPVPGPIIVPADNNLNWKDAPANPSTNNHIANKPTSFTHLWSKLRWSNNTNEQLAKVLSQLTNTLDSNQTPRPNTNSRGTPILAAVLSLTSLIISCSNASYTSMLIQHNSTWTLQKSTL